MVCSMVRLYCAVSTLDHGYLIGDKARDCFLESNLSPEDLWQIWYVLGSFGHRFPFEYH